ncbi:YagK/YfjJ domain-containing protein [Burkholderia metallica]|uniref:inovirus-type Gp2 protein n=1 Tax=Burkholderia metallica TaxID=488729 RepID=UPI001CF26E7D|nr:inovirus-type Gp2 protein [Burkholderia metallica]MCA8001375.1 inovirus Gp2 family protein [Burkholderia metallica]
MNNLIEDLETQEVLARHDERNRYEEIEINGRKTILRHRSMRYLFTIEKFVKAIEDDYEKKGKAKGIRERVGRDGFLNTKKHPLGKTYYGKLNEWLERYREGTRYSPHVEAFHEACKELGIIGKRRFWFGEPGDTDAQHNKPYTDWFNAVIVKIHGRCQSREFKERERLLKIHVKRNIDNVAAFEQELFSDEVGRARWLVLDLTLQLESKYRGSSTLEDFQQYRDKFFRARWRNNHVMSCVKAYVWAIEEGEDTGFHLHVILFCLPVTKDDERLANQIGDYWADVVTEGRGKYWNSNREDLKPGYERRGHGIGVGLIDHRDSKMRGSLLVNLLYLAKSEQQLQIRAEGNVHTFGMSGVPKKEKLGRPRKASVEVVESDDVDGFGDGQLEGVVVRQGSVSASTGATSRPHKTGVPLPFPIEATVSWHESPSGEQMEKSQSAGSSSWRKTYHC